MPILVDVNHVLSTPMPTSKPAKSNARGAHRTHPIAPKDITFLISFLPQHEQEAFLFAHPEVETLTIGQGNAPMNGSTSHRSPAGIQSHYSVNTKGTQVIPRSQKPNPQQNAELDRARADYERRHALGVERIEEYRRAKGSLTNLGNKLHLV